MKEFTEDELQEIKSNGALLRVKDLKEFIETHNLKDDAVVMIQRVEDFYYEENNWKVLVKKDWNGFPTQYHPAFSCVKYKSESNDLLFIDLHF